MSFALWSTEGTRDRRGKRGDGPVGFGDYEYLMLTQVRLQKMIQPVGKPPEVQD